MYALLWGRQISKSQPWSLLDICENPNDALDFFLQIFKQYLTDMPHRKLKESKMYCNQTGSMQKLLKRVKNVTTFIKKKKKKKRYG